MTLWIAFTLMAVVMQAVRTAAQKDLSRALSPMATTLTRYLYGIPFVALYLAVLLQTNTEWANSFNLAQLNNARFLVFATVAAIVQIIATAFMVKMFTLKNFAIATSFAKTEAIQVALFASVFFQDHLNVYGWVSVFIGVVGVLFVSGLKIGKSQAISSATIFYGTLSGALFAWTSLSLREASLSLDLPLVYSAALTLMYMVIIQTVICAIYITFKERRQWQKLMALKKRGLFVGATSALGSVGWFTAMSLQNPALVKTLGQVEFFITLGITHFYFKERIKWQEMVGIMCIIASILLILYV